MIHSNLECLLRARGMTAEELQDHTDLPAEIIDLAMSELIAECRLSALHAIAETLRVRVVDLFWLDKD